MAIIDTDEADGARWVIGPDGFTAWDAAGQITRTVAWADLPTATGLPSPDLDDLAAVMAWITATTAQETAEAPADAARDALVAAVAALQAFAANPTPGVLASLTTSALTAHAEYEAVLDPDADLIGLAVKALAWTTIAERAAGAAGITT